MNTPSNSHVSKLLLELPYYYSLKAFLLPRLTRRKAKKLHFLMLCEEKCYIIFGLFRSRPAFFDSYVFLGTLDETGNTAAGKEQNVMQVSPLNP